MSDVLHLPADGLDLTDTAVLYELVEHRAGCPVQWQPDTRAARMEHYDASSRGRPVHVVRCVECGAQAVIGD